MDSILSAAFVIATVAFFKEQFGFNGKVSIIAAFFVALVIGMAPQIAALFPAFEGWITSLVKVIILFLSAAGSVDAIRQLKRTPKIK